MGLLKFMPLTGKEHREELHINKKNKNIDACLKVYKYIDKDTNHHVAYIPSLEISGYGKTKSECTDMLHFSLEEYFDILLSLSDDKLGVELRKFGWAKNKFKNKDYSKAYIDISGNLKDFAIPDTVQEEILAY
jgi:hypothetical protein